MTCFTYVQGDEVVYCCDYAGPSGFVQELAKSAAWWVDVAAACGTPQATTEEAPAAKASVSSVWIPFQLCLVLMKGDISNQPDTLATARVSAFIFCWSPSHNSMQRRRAMHGDALQGCGAGPSQDRL